MPAVVARILSGQRQPMDGGMPRQGDVGPVFEESAIGVAVRVIRHEFLSGMLFAIFPRE